jgi:hypothetical protein
MKQHVTEEKVKPFRLVKYFSFTSLILIFVGTLIFSLLNTHWAKAMQEKKKRRVCPRSDRKSQPSGILAVHYPGCAKIRKDSTEQRKTV